MSQYSAVQGSKSVAVQGARATLSLYFMAHVGYSLNPQS